jgi:hypothetical protein
MRVLSVSWNGNTDDTKVKYTKEFEEASWIVKLDTLSDTIAMLSERYNSLLAPDREEYEN